MFDENWEIGEDTDAYSYKKVRLQRSAFTELVYAGLGKRSDALEKQMFTLMVSNKQM